MAVVIRLQGLPVVAGSGDIRHFFTGLNIPDGGVHIIGGKLGEAFIIFATDEDARRAMSRTGGIVKNAHIQLFLSSRTEMQTTLELSRKGNRKHPAIPPLVEVNKLPMGIPKGNIPNKLDQINSELPMHVERYDRKELKPSKDDDVYVYLYGLPYSVTEEDIKKFFNGLHVAEIIFQLRSNGMKNGNGFVKFGSGKDATAALERNNSYIGTRYISIKKATEEMWVSSGGQVGGSYSKQPRKRSRSRSPQNQQYYLHLKNLPFTLEKHDIKKIFGFPDLADSQIKFLLDKSQNRTGQGFLMVKSEWQYNKAITLHKTNCNGRQVLVAPISRKAMLDVIEAFENQESGSNPNTKRCIYVRNFPFDVSKPEVQRFFTGFTVREEDIFLLFDGKGVGLGEALVKFRTEQQALFAENLNRQRFLGTEVLLRRISDEQVKEFGVFIETPAETILTDSPMYGNEHHLREQSYGMRGDMRDGMRGDMRDGMRDDMRDDMHNAMKFGDGELRRSPKRFHGSNSMRFPGEEPVVGRLDMRNRSHPSYHRSVPVPHHGYEDRPSGGLVHMKNMPYKATTAEILDFFYGFNISPQSIQVKFDDKGMATGLATVFFETYEEALAAVNELNEKPIGARKIILNLQRV